MTPRFILDENVVICAQLGVDERGKTSPICADLVRSIIDICHPIVVDANLWQRYEEQLYRPRNEPPQLGPHLMSVLRNALQTVGKVEGLGREAPPFHGEAAIPAGSRDDTFIVRLAVEFGAVLVTADQPLRDDLAASGIQARHGLVVRRPDEALDEL